MIRENNVPVAVDCIVSRVSRQLGKPWCEEILLVERKNAPFGWAFPGGFLEPNEDLDEAAARELLEETGIVARGLWQLGAYGKPGRDPRGPVVSVVFVGGVSPLGPQEPVAADDARNAAWFRLDELPKARVRPRADHQRLLPNGSTEKMKDSDLHWLAGLLEGERCFKSSGNGVSIILGMTDLDVVLRAQSILGYEAHLQAPRIGKPGTKPMNYLQINSKSAVEWMHKLRPLMGQRRQAAIDLAIEKFKNLPGKGWNRGLGRKTECHPDRKHYAHGLCNYCYAKKLKASRRKG